MFDFDEGNLDTTVEDLLNDAEAELKGEGASGGLAVLNVMVAVSALVSAILFWEYSDEIFAGVWKPAALVQMCIRDRYAGRCRRTQRRRHAGLPMV